MLIFLLLIYFYTQSDYLLIKTKSKIYLTYHLKKVAKKITFPTSFSNPNSYFPFPHFFKGWFYAFFKEHFLLILFNFLLLPINYHIYIYFNVFLIVFRLLSPFWKIDRAGALIFGGEKGGIWGKFVGKNIFSLVIFFREGLI